MFHHAELVFEDLVKLGDTWQVEFAGTQEDRNIDLEQPRQIGSRKLSRGIERREAASAAFAVMVWVPGLSEDVVMLNVPPVATPLPSGVPLVS